MKKWFDFQYFKIALYFLFVIILAILFDKFIGNIGVVSINIRTFFTTTKRILTPILYGMLFAYLMNPGVIWFEQKLHLLTPKKRSNNQTKVYRTPAILMVYAVLFGFIFITINYMVPKILSNIRELYTNMPHYIHSLQTILIDFQETIDYVSGYLPPNYLESITRMLQPSNLSPAFINSVIGHIFSSALNITSLTLNIILAFVIAFYLLKQKETFANGTIKLTYALLPKTTASKLIKLAKVSNSMFSRFFIGKAIDSLIIGIICFVGLSLLKNRYALLLSLIVGVTNMIPYFGPFIGAIPAIIITLFEGLLPALFVALFIFALQQFDGMFLGPKILGDSIGLSPFWIIGSIIIGGALWGVMGMFFGVPLCATILLVINEWADKKLKYKNINISGFQEND